MLDFGGTAQKLWVLHCLDSFRPFLLVAKLRMLSSFAVSRLAYLSLQSKEIVIDMLPDTGWYGPKAFIHISLLSSLFVSCYCHEKLLYLCTLKFCNL